MIGGLRIAGIGVPVDCMLESDLRTKKSVWVLTKGASVVAPQAMALPFFGMMAKAFEMKCFEPWLSLKKQLVEVVCGTSKLYEPMPRTFCIAKAVEM